MPDYAEYITNYGDTWDVIAFQFYDDHFLASILIQSNPEYADVIVFQNSVSINIPVIDTVKIPVTLPPWRQ